MADDWVIVSDTGITTKDYRGQRLEADEWTTSVFVRRRGRWVCVLSQVTAASS